ncbi:MAG: PmoA family protein [Bacteroidota bacterium]
MNNFSATFFFSLLYFLWATGCQTSRTFTFAVNSTESSQPIGPVFINLPPEIQAEEHFLLTDAKTQEILPFQKLGETQGVFILPSPLSQGESRNFTLSPTDKPPFSNFVKATVSEEEIAITLKGQPILNYQVNVQEPPAGNPSYYKRNGFIHPLFSPGGQILTEDFPEDHMHHHGIFFAWVNTLFRGEKIDFWNQQNQSGTVSHVEIIDTLSGPVYAQFTCRLQQETLTGKLPEAALDEVWQVSAYHVGPNYLLDFSSSFSASSEDTLFIQAYHYGGFAFRGPDTWFDSTYIPKNDSLKNYLGVGKGGFLTSEGKTRINGNHSRPNWVDMHGMVDDQEVGVCFFDHPENFRFPQPVRLHPSMPYFSFSPMVLGAFHIGPDDSYRSQYRIMVHQGVPDTSDLNLHWEAYANRPEIHWENRKEP